MDLKKQVLGLILFELAISTILLLEEKPYQPSTVIFKLIFLFIPAIWGGYVQSELEQYLQKKFPKYLATLYPSWTKGSWRLKRLVFLMRLRSYPDNKSRTFGRMTKLSYLFVLFNFIILFVVS